MAGAEIAAPWREPGAAPFIRISGVTKIFGGFTAVDSLSLEIYKGELFCLLGGSGSGKSTLLRMLAGFETPDRGVIEIDGRDVSADPPWARPVNMMFQSYALFPHMSVEKNIAYGLRQDRLPRAEIAERVARMLDLVKLGPFGRRKPHQLSGGQRQRVALARALAREPKVLLLDEPLSALDKKLREETQFELVDIQERLGTTFVVVTHDQEEAMSLASRIGVMDKGRLMQVDEPRDIYEFPKSRFIADFVGDVNLFEARMTVDEPDRMVAASEETGGDIAVGHGVAGKPGQKVWIAVRPEKIRITREAPGPGFNSAAGVVEDIAYLGGLSHYRIRLASGRMVRATRANTDRHEEAPPTWEEAVHVSWTHESGVALTS